MDSAHYGRGFISTAETIKLFRHQFEIKNQHKNGDTKMRLLEFQSKMDDAFDDMLAKRNLGFGERFAARREYRSQRRSIFKDFCRTFAEREGTPFLEGDGDRPILEFWKWLIENEKVQAFWRFVLEEALPAVIEFISKLLPLIAVL